MLNLAIRGNVVRENMMANDDVKSESRNVSIMQDNKCS